MGYIWILNIMGYIKAINEVARFLLVFARELGDWNKLVLAPMLCMG